MKTINRATARFPEELAGATSAEEMREGAGEFVFRLDTFALSIEEVADRLEAWMSQTVETVARS